MSIAPIDSDSVHRLTSGQIVVDLTSAVKEVLENALDAHATTVEVKFWNYGLESFEVADNGDGVAPDDFAGIAQRHHTSKLREFRDLESVGTLGFRGEALNALCSIGELAMVTRRQQDVVATRLEFDAKGVIKSQATLSATKGTTVTVSNLFRQLPVRRKDLEKNIKREFGKALALIQQYAVVCVGTRITVSNIGTSGKKTIQLLSNGKDMQQNIVNVFGTVSVNGLMPLKLSLEWTGRSVFGGEDYTANQVTIDGYISEPVFGKGRQSADRQLFFVNSRPCSLPKVAKAITEVYKQYNYVQAPMVVANLLMSREAYDVNVSPDKRTILLHQEGLLIEELRSKLTEAFDEASHSVPKAPVVSLASQKAPRSSLLSSFRMSRSSPVPSSDDDGSAFTSTQTPLRSVRTALSLPAKISGKEYPGSLSRFAAGSSQSTEPISEPPSDVPDSRQTEEETQEEHAIPQESEMHSNINEVPFVTTGGQSEPGESEQEADQNDAESEQEAEQEADEEAAEPQQDEQEPLVDIPIDVAPPSPGPDDALEAEQSEKIFEEQDAVSQRPNVEDWHPLLEQSTAPGTTTIESEEVTAPPPVQEHIPDASQEASQDDDLFVSSQAPMPQTHQSSDVDLASGIAKDVPVSAKGLYTLSRAKKYATLNKVVRMEADPNAIRKKFRERRTLHDRYLDASKKMGVRAVDYAADADEVEQNLSLIIRKSDFLTMRVIGQFNLGFILVMKPRNGADQGIDDLLIVDQHASDEKFNFERLQYETVMKSQPLVVPRQLNLSVVEELTLIKHLDVFKKNGFVVSVDENAPPGQQCTLLSLPSSKTLVFDENDLHELIYLVSESPNNPSVRCTKVRAMFAMRACRSSIMVGKPLTTPTMKQVVKNLAGLDKPWNCPHGRPTLRHITTVDKWVFYDEDM